MTYGIDIVIQFDKCWDLMAWLINNKEYLGEWYAVRNNEGGSHSTYNKEDMLQYLKTILLLDYYGQKNYDRRKITFTFHFHQEDAPLLLKLHY